MAEKKAFLLRIPPDLWDDLNRWSTQELRSVNAQIEYVLRQALQRWKRSADGGRSEDSPAKQGERAHANERQEEPKSRRAPDAADSHRAAPGAEKPKEPMTDESQDKKETGHADGWFTSVD